MKPSTSTSSTLLSLTAASLGLIGLAVTAHAQLVSVALQDFVTDAGNYNVVATGNVSFDDITIQGPLAVGGNLSLTSSTVANNASTYSPLSGPTLYVKGTVSLSGSSTLANGYASLPGLGTSTWTASSRTLKVGTGTLKMSATAADDKVNPKTNPIPAGWNWNALEASSTTAGSFNWISTELANATATGTFSVTSTGSHSGNLILAAPVNPSSPDVVFDLNAALIKVVAGKTYYNNKLFTNLTINVPTGLTYVIDVTNAANTDFLNDITFSSGSNDNHLIWNFEGSGNLDLASTGGFYGAIVANNYNLTASTTIDGQVVAKTFTEDSVMCSSGDLDEIEFVPTCLPVPEPASFALLGAAFCILGVFVRRNRRSVAASQSQA